MRKASEINNKLCSGIESRRCDGVVKCGAAWRRRSVTYYVARVGQSAMVS